MANKALQRTPNSPRLFANAFGMISQKATPRLGVRQRKVYREIEGQAKTLE